MTRISRSFVPSRPCPPPCVGVHFSFDISLWSCPSLSLTGLMRWQHRGHPPLYCSLFMLNLNVLSVPGHYLKPCPWAAAVSLFNPPRWQEVRDCSELLSHTASREKHSSITSSPVHPCPLSSCLASHSIFCLS